MALFAYLSIFILIPLLTDAKNNPFVKFHIKQGLALIVFEVIAYVIAVVPKLGWLIGWLLWVVATVLGFVGVINVLSNKEHELPLIGKFGDKFNF